jgi:hypothetical protein
MEKMFKCVFNCCLIVDVKLILGGMFLRTFSAIFVLKIKERLYLFNNILVTTMVGSFKFILKVGVGESIENAPLV